jgi:hypothetical protein
MMRLPISIEASIPWKPEPVASVAGEARPRSPRAGQPEWERSADEPAAAEPVDVAAVNHSKSLVIGVVLGVLMLAGMCFLVFSHDGQPPAGAAVAAPPAPAAPPVESFESTIERAQQLETTGVPVVKRFLAARTAEEFAPLVRHPGVTLPRIREFLAGKPPKLVNLRQFKVVRGTGGFYAANLSLDDFSTRSMSLEDTPDGVLIDWEAWVGWSAMPWKKFKAAKPTEPQLFRVTMKPVDYFNYTFSDEQQWSSWLLTSPDLDDTLYGFVARGSDVEQRLLSMVGDAGGVMTVMLAFPANATADNMCQITKVVAPGWAELPAAAPEAPQNR